MRRRLGEHLLQSGLITEPDLRVALTEQKKTREPLGVILTRRGIANENQIANALARQLGLPYVHPGDEPVDPRVLGLIPRDLALGFACVPIRLDQHVLTVAMADPLLLGIVTDLETRTGYRVQQVVAARGEILALVNVVYPESPAPALFGTPEVDDVDPSAVAAAADAVVSMAAESFGEVRIEPTATEVLVRRRLDGTLRQVSAYPGPMRDPLSARLKTLAGMDSDERRLPQDGEIHARTAEGDVVVRVAARRSPFGEAFVFRHATDERPQFSPSSLGFSTASFEALVAALERPSGLMLFVGPPGSGARTAARVAYEAAAPGRTRATADTPDLVLAGELESDDQVALALEQAQSGALVLGVVRADDGATAVDRIKRFSWSPDLVLDALAGIVTCRVVRRLCDQCRRQLASTVEEGPSFEASACSECDYTGFSGRIGLFEVVRVDDGLRPLAARGGAELHSAAVNAGMASLLEDGLRKVRAGVTTRAELDRVRAGEGPVRGLCEECGTVVGDDETRCAHCGHGLGAACQNCGEFLRLEWGVCPFCGRSVGAGTLGDRLS